MKNDIPKLQILPVQRLAVAGRATTLQFFRHGGSSKKDCPTTYGLSHFFVVARNKATKQSICKGYLSEIFDSIQGEGIYVGVRHIFLRFAGCNLHCDYCDTPQALRRRKYCNIINCYPVGQGFSPAKSKPNGLPYNSVISKIKNPSVEKRASKKGTVPSRHSEKGLSPFYYYQQIAAKILRNVRIIPQLHKTINIP